MQNQIHVDVDEPVHKLLQFLASEDDETQKYVLNRLIVSEASKYGKKIPKNLARYNWA